MPVTAGNTSTFVGKSFLPGRGKNGGFPTSSAHPCLIGTQEHSKHTDFVIVASERVKGTEFASQCASVRETSFILLILVG